MDIGVMGVGVVGKAVKQAFESVTKVIAYDIAGEYSNPENIEEMKNKCDVIFVCAPSPTIDGKQDLSALHDICGKLSSINYTGVVCLKSTVLPGTSRAMAETYGLRIVHNPEFLTAAWPYKDFMSQKSIILGGADQDTIVVAYAYRMLFPSIDILCYKKPVVSELSKYYHNCFLASKVTIANEFYDLCQKVGADYNAVREAAASQGGIGTGHNKVPGPDGKLGFGLFCFPKDTQALLSFCEERGINLHVLKATVEGNNTRRKFDNTCREIGEAKITM